MIRTVVLLRMVSERRGTRVGGARSSAGAGAGAGAGSGASESLMWWLTERRSRWPTGRIPLAAPVVEGSEGGGIFVSD